MTPVTPQTQEIRLATTMTGGVSLAIWMGGVARELNLLLQASDRRRDQADAGKPLAPLGADERVRQLYGRLLDVVDGVVEADVLSGTSAGGINAAMLAYCRVQNRDLGRLRDLWLDVGSLLDLLRRPSDTDVPSLLYGDEYMLDQLFTALPTLRKLGRVPDELPSTTLYVTTTLLTGESSRFTDAMGTLVQDTSQRGLFVFDEQQLAAEQVEAALALAARSTASFPAAFEPSFIPYESDVPAAGNVPLRPAMEQYADITRSHWVADGGLLDNQPLDVLLQRVFDQSADKQIRRVLLYVVPSSGPTPDLVKATPGDDVGKGYGLLDALFKDLSAVSAQSISEDLEAVREHNDNVDARYDLRRQLAELAVHLGGRRLLSPSALSTSVRRQHELQARPLVRAMLRVISTWPEKDVPTVASVRQVPAVAKPAVLTARTITTGSHRMVDSVRGRTGPVLGAGFAALVVGIALAVQSETIAGLSGLGLAMVGVYTIAIVTWQVSARLFGSLVAATLTGAVASLAVTPERHWLFGTSRQGTVPAKEGILAPHITWLADQWWRPLLVVGILLAVIAGIPLLATVISRAVTARLRTIRAGRRRATVQATAAREAQATLRKFAGSTLPESAVPAITERTQSADIIT